MNISDNDKDLLIKNLEIKNKKYKEYIQKSDSENSFERELPDNYLKVTNEKLIVQKKYEKLNAINKNLNCEYDIMNVDKEFLLDSIKEKDAEIKNLKQKIETRKKLEIKKNEKKDISNENIINDNDNKPINDNNNQNNKPINNN